MEREWKFIVSNFTKENTWLNLFFLGMAGMPGGGGGGLENIVSPLPYVFNAVTLQDKGEGDLENL